MSSKRMNRRVAGVTLIELIIAIVIVSAALAGLVAAFTRANRASVDPVITQQMVAIAETMMEEIMLKPFGPPSTGAGANRALYNDIRDFNGYPANSAVTDIGGTAIPGLGRYTVTVNVEELAANAVTNIAPAGDAVRIRVTVRNGAESFVLTGWKMRP
jgi:MSHA pilin protein MshD